jgi:inhibitor of cysteine peptidase
MRQDMRKFTAPLILLCLSILLSGCSAGNPIQLYQIDSGRTIRMQSNGTLKIVLDANPTTGYQWKAMPWDTDVIEQIDEPVYKPRSEAIGSGGEITFYFKALSTGQTPIKFIYFRAFEKDVSPIKSFKVTIVVS